MAEIYNFDALTKMLASSVPRRTIFGRVAALFGGAILGVFGLPRRGVSGEQEKLNADITAVWTAGSPNIIVLSGRGGNKHAESFICVGTGKFQKAPNNGTRYLPVYSVIACPATPKECLRISTRDCYEAEFPGEWKLKDPKDLVE